ncbi:MAG: lipoprotein [Betaproteobacteria bacterium]
MNRIVTCGMKLWMLRRSVSVLFVAAALATTGCGIKGPLRLPPAKPGASDTSVAPPARPSSETPAPSVPEPATESTKPRVPVPSSEGPTQ